MKMSFSSCGQYVPAWGSSVKAKPFGLASRGLDPAARPGSRAAKRKTSEVNNNLSAWCGLPGESAWFPIRNRALDGAVLEKARTSSLRANTALGVRSSSLRSARIEG